MNHKTKISIRGFLAFFLCFSLLLCPLSVSAAGAAVNEDVRVGSRIFDLFFGKQQSTEKTLFLCPGGQAFGMKIRTQGLTVSVITNPEAPIAKQLLLGDILLSVNGTKLENEATLYQALENTKGPLALTVLRGKEKKTLLIPPIEAQNDAPLGIEVKSTAAGIGTVTYIDPESGAFGGLGHGICAPDTGEIYPMKSGTVTEVILGGVLRGLAGKPGELRGVLSRNEIGKLDKNTACGVFGTLSLEGRKLPQAIPVGTRAELTLGEAEILSSLKNGTPQRYSIRITEIDRSATDSKSFRIEVTDPTLIALTGGIVRGMSGSPIIQNGKLVGAVTQVLVANPTEGNGIFIENMLNAAQQQALPKAA